MTKSDLLGWAWPVNCRKAHLIDPERRSLCGRWMYLGKNLEKGNDGSPDNCPSCLKALAKLPEGSWRLDADTGWIAADGDLVRLEGNVAADSQGDNPSQASLRTDRLELLPAQDQARTDARVTLTQPGIIQTGVGMDADLKNRTYRIKSQVKVRYDTQKR